MKIGNTSKFVKIDLYIGSPTYACIDVSLYHITYMFPIDVCFQTKVIFLISRLCFQSNSYVSNIHIMFPKSNVCLQYTFFISKCKWCFQTTMFPMYYSNIHRAVQCSNERVMSERRLLLLDSLHFHSLWTIGFGSTTAISSDCIRFKTHAGLLWTTISTAKIPAFIFKW